MIRRAAEEALDGVVSVSEDSPRQLARMLEHDSHYVRVAVTEAMGALGEAAAPAVPHLVDLSGSDRDYVRESALEAIAAIGAPANEAAGTVRMLAEREGPLQRAASQALAAIEGKSAS